MNIEEIMKAAQNVQAELEKAQSSMDAIEVEGAAGGGLVKVRASAKGRLLGVDKQMLEDLIAAAFNDAKTKADKVSQEQLSKMTAGLPLPPGFKLPF